MSAMSGASGEVKPTDRAAVLEAVAQPSETTTEKTGVAGSVMNTREDEEDGGVALQQGGVEGEGEGRESERQRVVEDPSLEQSLEEIELPELKPKAGEAHIKPQWVLV